MPAGSPFAQSEHLARLARTKERMVALELDCLLVSDPANMFYLSGYDAWSFYVDQGLVVLLDEEEPLWIGREIDRRGAELTSFLAPDRLIGYADEYVQSDVRHPMELVARVLRDRGLGQARIGVEDTAYYYTVRAHAALGAGLPDATLVPAGTLVNWVRAVKSHAEIALMRHAARIVEAAMTAAYDAIEPGARECDVAAAIYAAQMCGLRSGGGGYPSSPPFLLAGSRAATPHLSWSDAPLRAGEGVNLELVGCRHRYHAPLARTVWLGAPPRRVRDVAAAAVEGLEAAVAAVRPGATCADVEAAWRATAGRHGIAKASRCGYSIGVAYPPTFGERTFSLRPEDDTILEPGMAMHVIPGLWLDGWGLVITEPVVVTDRGCELLCDFPRELLVKG